MALLLLGLSGGTAYAGSVYPAASWASATPESVGISSSRLAANLQSLPGPLVVVRNGYQVYSKGSISQSMPLYSVSKSLTALIFGRLVQLDKANPDDLVPGSGLPTAPLATFRHFMSMTSDYGLVPHSPGDCYAYNNNAVHFYGTHMARTYFGGRSPVQVLQESLWAFTGRQDPIYFDGQWGGWGGGWRLSARDAARIGLLVLRGGMWNGTQVLPDGFIDQLHVSQIDPGAVPNWNKGPASQWNEHVYTQDLKGNYSWGWWLVRNAYPQARAAAIAGLGHRGKKLIVCPQYDLVIVALPDQHITPDAAQYLNAVVDAITGSGTPPSTGTPPAPATPPAPLSNTGPRVDAGPARTITLPTTTTTLQGSVTDDGRPSPPARVTTTWSQVSGPGTVTFSHAAALAPTATFSAAGSYVLRLTASDGALSASDTVTIAVNPAAASGPLAVTSFTLINADTGQPVPGFDPLPRYAVVSLAALPTRNLNIRANTAPAVVGSVRISLSGAGAVNRTDSEAPYSVFGDTSGSYAAWIPRVGNHNLTARPYSGPGAGGTAGPAFSITFTVKH
jgi:hypothetical protein